jgi:hypothetical protein
MVEDQMIAIDPGAKGGIVTTRSLGQQGESVTAISMPKTDRDVFLALQPQASDERVAYLEELIKFAGRNMPSSSMAVYAANWGFIKGVLTALKFRIVLVHPKKWQAALGLGGSKSHASQTAWKHHLQNRAEQLFPNIKVTQNTADALLIYEAARQGKI